MKAPLKWIKDHVDINVDIKTAVICAGKSLIACRPCCTNPAVFLIQPF